RARNEPRRSSMSESEGMCPDSSKNRTERDPLIVAVTQRVRANQLASGAAVGTSPESYAGDDDVFVSARCRGSVSAFRCVDRRRLTHGWSRERFQAAWTEAVAVPASQFDECGRIEFHLAAPAAEQASALKGLAALRTALFSGEHRYG